MNDVSQLISKFCRTNVDQKTKTDTVIVERSLAQKFFTNTLLQLNINAIF